MLEYSRSQSPISYQPTTNYEDPIHGYTKDVIETFHARLSTDSLIRPKRPTPGACIQPPLVDFIEPSPITCFQKSFSLTELFQRSATDFDSEHQLNINSSASSFYPGNCLSYPGSVTKTHTENTIASTHETNDFLFTKASLNADRCDLDLSLAATTNAILTQATCATEPISSPFASPSTSSCSLCLIEDEGELAISTDPAVSCLDEKNTECNENNNSGSNNNKNNNNSDSHIADKLMTLDQEDCSTTEVEALRQENFNTNSSCSPPPLRSAINTLKSTLWNHTDDRNNLDDKQSTIKADDETSVRKKQTDKTPVYNQQCYTPGTDNSSQDNKAGSLAHVLPAVGEPASTGDDSDDSDLYIRRRLVEINAKFAEEPLPPDRDGERETKVTFKTQLVDLIAPTPESPDPNQSDEVPPKPTEENGWIATHMSHRNIQSPIEPVAHEDAYVLQMVKVTVPIAEVSHAELIQSSTKEQQRPNLKSKTNATISKQNSSPARFRSTEVASPHGPARNRPKTTESATSPHLKVFTGSASAEKLATEPTSVAATTMMSAKCSTPKRIRSKSARQPSVRHDSELDHANPSANAVTAWIKEKNRVLQAKRRAELEEQMRAEEERKRKQQQDEEQRAKQLTAWLKAKSKQIRQERELRQRQEAERTYFTVTHSKKDCEKAFQQWLQRKALENQQRLQEARERLNITRRLMRRCRAAENLARAIDQARIFKLI